MKKLMLTAAVMAAGAAMAVESANIVGYAASELNDTGVTLGGGQFLDVGAAQLSLTNIKPVGAGDGEVYLNVLDSAGYTIATYTWADWGDPDIGWQDDSMAFIDDTVKVAPGSSFWIQCDTTGVTLQSAGQVPTSDVSITLNDNGVTIVGNPFPTAVKLNTVVAQDAGDGEVYLNVLDSSGYTISTYTWADWGDPDIGWQDDSMAFIDDTVEVAPGQGFWTQCDTTGASLYFPGLSL